MDTALLVTRLLVAVVFGISGVSKLFDFPGSVAAAESFGVPTRLSRVVGVGLPFAEIGIAFGLVLAATAPIAGAVGAALMGAFIVAISINLARGKRPDCHCFGKLHSAPIGWQTVVRNSVIGAGSASIALAGPGEGLVTGLQRLEGSHLVLLALLLVALGVIGWQWRALGDLSTVASTMADRIATIESLVNGHSPADIPGPEVGTTAPAFLLHSVGKGMVSLDALRALGKPMLLVFAEPTCSVCNVMMPKLARWKHDLSDVLTVAVISTGGEDDNRRKVERYGLDWVLLQERREVTMSYRVPGTPAAVLLDRNGSVASPLVYGPDPIIDLLKKVADAAIAVPPVTTKPQPVQQTPMPTLLNPSVGAN